MRAHDNYAANTPTGGQMEQQHFNQQQEFTPAAYNFMMQQNQPVVYPQSDESPANQNVYAYAHDHQQEVQEGEDISGNPPRDNMSQDYRPGQQVGITPIKIDMGDASAHDGPYAQVLMYPPVLDPIVADADLVRPAGHYSGGAASRDIGGTRSVGVGAQGGAKASKKKRGCC